MIAITINRKVNYLKTSYKVNTGQWDEDKKEVRDYPNHKAINANIRKQISELEGHITVQQLQGGKITGKLLKRGTVQKSFKDFALELRSTRGDVKEVNRLLEFCPDTFLTDIDGEFLRKYEQHERARGMKQNTINTTFKYLRRTLNQAEREGLIKVNPMDNFLMPKYEQTDRVYLTDHELKKLHNLFDKDLPESVYQSLCYFLLGCYSGLRYSDWKQFDAGRMVENDLLRLRARKNNEFVVLPIGPTLAGIIERVKNLPPPQTKEAINRMLKVISLMAGIDRKITTHVGRHTFGYICASRRLPKSVTAELMGITVKVVEVYYHLAGVDIVEQAAVLKTI